MSESNVTAAASTNGKSKKGPRLTGETRIQATLRAFKIIRAGKTRQDATTALVKYLRLKKAIASQVSGQADEIFRRFVAKTADGGPLPGVDAAEAELRGSAPVVADDGLAAFFADMPAVLPGASVAPADDDDDDFDGEGDDDDSDEDEGDDSDD